MIITRILVYLPNNFCQEYLLKLKQLDIYLTVRLFWIRQCFPSHIFLLNISCSSRNLELFGCPLKENQFGKSALLMNVVYIVFPKVIYEFTEWLLHVELTFMALSLDWMNWLMKLVVSQKKYGEKVVKISCKNAVFNLL